MAVDTPEIFDPAEDCPWFTPREILARYGYSALPPNELNNQQLSGRLWELLYAAAARRFFFCFTDHLDDRSLYMLLWEKWLAEPTADIPLSAETKTTTIISEFDAAGMSQQEIWLRYYADETDRKLWHSTDPDFVCPPKDDPPCDRDQFLPTPPIPLEVPAGCLPGDDDPLEQSESDPLELAEMDDETSFAKAESMPDVPAVDGTDFALEAQLGAMEPENWTSPAKQLAKESVPLLPPAEVTDETLTPILWELLHNLALRGFYLLHTDHLSDRELYAELWERGLRDPAHLSGRNPRGGWFHDFLGSWGDEERQVWLRYYASEEERNKHAHEWPMEIIPSKERPPCNRDWRLPKGPLQLR